MLPLQAVVCLLSSPDDARDVHLIESVDKPDSNKLPGGQTF